MNLSIDNQVVVENIVEGKRVGVGFPKTSPNMLMFANYANKSVVPPKSLRFWRRRNPFPIYETGNNEHGCCAIASQAIFQMKMERLERRITAPITQDEILRVYYNLTKRLYGGGDTGCYEVDALNNWRNKDLTFRDSKCNEPLTIDAYTKVNHFNIEEVKRAIFMSGGKGIKVCFALPMAWSGTLTWDIPEGQQLVGEWQKYSWGGHSQTCAEDYDENWIYINHTWNCPVGKISWKAFQTYATEVHVVIDSLDEWRKKVPNKTFNAKALISDINNVSDLKIK